MHAASRRASDSTGNPGELPMRLDAFPHHDNENDNDEDSDDAAAAADAKERKQSLHPQPGHPWTDIHTSANSCSRGIYCDCECHVFLVECSDFFCGHMTESDDQQT